MIYLKGICNQNVKRTLTTQYKEDKWPNLKWTKYLNRYFTKEDTHIANRRISTPLVIR